MPGWNGWVHAIGNTYGTWLPGDPRGWRERHHRRHVDGDYHDPPPPDPQRHRRSIESLERPPVRLTTPAPRALACRCFGERLQLLGIDVIEIAATPVHFHILARLDGQPQSAKILVGLAKQHAAHELREAGHVTRGGVWAKGCQTKPIADRRHQLHVVKYIRDHATQNAAIWSTLRK